jgi:hypothetical protein
VTATKRILTTLRERAVAAKKNHEVADDAVRIRGAWNTSYVIELAETSSRLHLHYVVVQTVAQGCCYYEPAIEDPGVSEALLGVDAVSGALGAGAWHVAALDAVYALLCREPDDSLTIDGSNIEKSGARASAVSAEVERLLDTFESRKQQTVVNVGVVGDFLAVLGQKHSIELTASDYYQHIVGTEVSGVMVQHGSSTLRLVAEADVALVTGMTLANGTLDEILAIARANDTAVVIFAQTGAHFAETYLDYGATTVVAEPLPFYLSGDGPSTINLFRGSKHD